MENGKTEPEELMESLSSDKDHMEETNLEIVQLQGLVAELREGLRGALAELNQLRHRDHGLEDKLAAHETEVDDKIMSLKNSLNTFKEELNVALIHIKDVSFRQNRMESLQNARDFISVPQRQSSKSDFLSASGDDHVCLSGASDLSLIQHFLSGLQYGNNQPQRSAASPHTSMCEQEVQQQKAPAWGERKNSREETQTGSSHMENSKRQRVALELLESERVYVSHLSLLLKANISFNGSELPAKDKRPFPSALRFLIQQHLELLHTLQERVLRSQWQSIMGDVFMRLTSKESDFLDLYVSYLKELPECLSVVTAMASSSVSSSAFLESELMGDESKPSLHTLLLQPVQRIPEYLLLLQGLLRQTSSDHPDYFLLLVCIQQFRSFTAQHQRLLQHNQEILMLNRKELKRSSMKQLIRTVESGIQAKNIGSPYPCNSNVLEHSNVKRSKQRLMDQIQQSHRFQDWDPDPEPHCYDAEWPSQIPFYSPDLDSRSHRPSGLGCIPESEGSESSLQHRLPCRQPDRPAPPGSAPPGSALADALGEFLLPPDPPGMESLYEEDRTSLQDVPMYDRCSSASSDSSIDIAFVKCPKSPPPSNHAMASNAAVSRDFGNGSHGNGYKLHNRGCVSPDEAVMMRHSQHRPLQASQRKSKSLNGLQMENTVNLDGVPLSEHIQRLGLGSHTKLERQGSKGSRGFPTPSRKNQSPIRNLTDLETHEDLHGLISIDSGFQSWGDDSKWRAGPEEISHAPLSERSRKQDKGGFRSSFKKLFKKKSNDEKKEKSSEKTTAENQNNEHETAGKTQKLAHLEINRGTAV